MSSLTIYVQMLNEGTPVYRPVSAEKLGDSRFRILSECDHDEVWQFETGSIVIGEPQELSTGIKIVAVRIAEN
ncbi:MAG: hypothetical protein IPH06_02355 [Alphaproteobacteria bacterium]|nr:hypothetical protein [Alphaproteobacteria bacterium]QQS56892.1 MAG: hypothetical protein IPN28_11610 [Alphaproteobacteria bacterium]